MDSMIFEGNAKAPAIDFNAETGLLKISGRSIPDDTFKVYNPIIEWLNQYSVQPNKTTTLDIRFEFINTSSSKFVFEILKKLEKLSNAGNDVTINWYYEEDDEDMMETGEDFQSIINIPMHILEIEEE